MERNTVRAMIQYDDENAGNSPEKDRTPEVWPIEPLRDSRVGLAAPARNCWKSESRRCLTDVKVGSRTGSARKPWVTPTCTFTTPSDHGRVDEGKSNR